MDGNGVLAIGPSGSGKSALALALMAHGAALISDDAVDLVAEPRGVTLSRPENAPPSIEARGLGLLNARPIGLAPLRLIVDLGSAESDRLPPRRFVACLGHRIELIRAVDPQRLAPAILHLLRHGRAET